MKDKEDVNDIIDYIPISAFDVDNISQEEVIIINNKSNMFKIDWTNIKGAIVSGLIVGLIGIIGYIVSVGDVFALDYKALVNAGVLGALASIGSLIKNFLTSEKGNFVGSVKVVD